MRKPMTAAVACLAFAACGSSFAFDKSTQYGPTPQLPEPEHSLLPQMKVLKVKAWSNGEKPTVPEGFRIEAAASGLANPRIVYPLPNGDLLIVEWKKDAK